MSEETLNYLDQLVRNEVTYEISSIIIGMLIIVSLLAFWFWCILKDKQTNKFRNEWYSNLTKEQKQAIKEKEKLKL